MSSTIPVIRSTARPIRRAISLTSGSRLEREQVGVAADRAERAFEVVRGPRGERGELARAEIDAREVLAEQRALAAQAARQHEADDHDRAQRQHADDRVEHEPARGARS